jgi:hypothetical protein
MRELLSSAMSGNLVEMHSRGQFFSFDYQEEQTSLAAKEPVSSPGNLFARRGMDEPFTGKG